MFARARHSTFLTVMAMFATNANADLFLVEANWSSTVTGQGFTNQFFQGAAAFTFDDSTLTGAGLEFITAVIPFPSFTQSPSPIGVTVNGFIVRCSLAKVDFMRRCCWRRQKRNIASRRPHHTVGRHGIMCWSVSNETISARKPSGV